MHSRQVARSLSIVLGLALLTSCTSVDTATGPLDAPAAAGDDIVPMCQAGCVDVDPSPDSAGIFIGQTSADQCTEGNDVDVDGLADWCETRIAQAFAPELKHWSADEMGRESKWAARWLDAEQTTVRVIYLLSYYRDAGGSAWVCSLPAPWWTESCFGHNGDSEAVVLDLRYHVASSHWVLDAAYYSQHGAWHDYPPTSNGYPSIQYPSQLGGYPRVWVAQGKHANYISQSACNAGAAFHADTCVDVDVATRQTAGSVYNIGSRIGHTASQDCWASEDPSYIYYGSGRTECYWTPKTFRGWIPESVGGMESGVYSTILLDAGF